MSASPRVSVVIPCYNQAQFLPEAVASVVEQTFQDWEVIIVNDGSTDKTSETARQLIARYSQHNLKLLEKPNGGLPDARNAGVRASAGEYFLPLDADDRIAPTFLARTLRVLEATPEIGFVYSDIQHFGLQTDQYRWPDFDAETLVHTENIVSVCALVRRSVWEQVCGYNTGMKEGFEDWDFWVGCVEKGWVGKRIPEPLFQYRKREGSMLTTTHEKRQRLIARIVLNHPKLYSPERLQGAEAALAGNAVAAKPRRLLLACTHFWPSTGGVETIVENLGSRLVQRGYKVSVATLWHPGRYCWLRRGIDIIAMDPGTRYLEKWPKACDHLSKLINSGDYDACVLFADPTIWVFWAVKPGSVPAHTRVLAQPIINADGYSHWKDKRSFRQQLAQHLKHFHSVVAISQNGQEVNFLREEAVPFVYLPNAAEPAPAASSFRQKFNLPEGKPLLLHVANLWRVKNHLGLLQALSFLPGDWQLVMIGHPSGDAAYVQQVREAAATDPRFLLIPGLPHAEVAGAMAAADVVLLASLGEVSPVTILEAMSHGKPWLATPACGAVHDNAGGLIAPLEQFPAVLQQLLDHPAQAKELGRLGREHWQACFAWDRVAAAWEQVILTGQTNEKFEMPATVREGMAGVRAEFDRMPASPARASHSAAVSVIVTCDRPERSGALLESLQRQTFQDFEIVLVSEPGCGLEGQLGELRERRRVVSLPHTASHGLAVARNKGLLAARGRWVAYLDANWDWLPHHLEALVALLEKTAQSVAYSEATATPNGLQPSRGWEWDANRLLYEYYIPGGCLVHERTCILAAGAFDELLGPQAEWDLLLRLAQRYPVAHLNQATCEWRGVDQTAMEAARLVELSRTTQALFEKHRAAATGLPEVLQKQKETLAALERARPWANRISRRWLSAKLRRSIRKRLATISQWFED